MVSRKRSRRRRRYRQKLYWLKTPVVCDSMTRELHVELQANHFPFQKREWRPLTAGHPKEFALTKCRPVSGSLAATGAAGPSLRSCVRQPRPCSVPIHLGRTLPHSASSVPYPPSKPRPDTPAGSRSNSGTLNHIILTRPSAIGNGCGDEVNMQEKRKWFVGEIGEMDDLSTTSGIDSDDDDNEEQDDEDNSDSDNSESEPTLEEVQHQMPYSQNVLLLHLRPEKMDAIDVPGNKRDMRRFDFNAQRVELPCYKFSCPIPEPFNQINLKLCATEGMDWREDNLVQVSGSLTENICSLMDRLQQLEKLQLMTEERETSKRRHKNRRQQTTSSGRCLASRNNVPVKDKQCCSWCLQADCIGDCLEGRLISGLCENCRQYLCTGSCADTYEQRKRHGSELDDKPTNQLLRTPSKGCLGYQKPRHVKPVQAKHLLVNRPKSSSSIITSNQIYNNNLRPVSANCLSNTLVKRFERLSLDTRAPRPPERPFSTRSRGRNNIMVGKSSRSNKRDSISDTNKKKIISTTLAPQVKVSKVLS